jgi:hypothetical protein
LIFYSKYLIIQEEVEDSTRLFLFLLIFVKELINILYKSSNLTPNLGEIDVTENNTLSA